MKALLLISLGRAESPADCPDPPYTATLVESTLQVLDSHFESSPLVSSCTWKSLLGALLKHSHPDFERPESCFKGEKGAEDGMYVWPKPVQLGAATLMLLKLIIDEEMHLRPAALVPVLLFIGQKAPDFFVKSTSEKAMTILTSLGKGDNKAKCQVSLPRRDRKVEICRQQGPGRIPIKRKPRNFKSFK